MLKQGYSRGFYLCYVMYGGGNGLMCEGWEILTGILWSGLSAMIWLNVTITSNWS